MAEHEIDAERVELAVPDLGPGRRRPCGATSREPGTPGPNSVTALAVENLADIHFHSTLEFDVPHGNLAYLYAFTGIGAFIIILACINYMNLSDSQVGESCGEIAMKKTLGSSKRSLILSFLGVNPMLLSLIAMVLAIGIVFFVIDATSFNNLVSKNLSANFFSNKILLFGTIGLPLFIGVLSGIYPALYLPSIPTLQALKGAFKNRKSSMSSSASR